MEELRLKAEHKTPTKWNKEAAIGALLGSLVTPIIGTLAGGFIGGSMGEKRIREENESGKLVSEPTMFNKDTLLGGLIGSALSFIPALALGMGATMLSASMGAGPETAILAGYSGLAAGGIGSVLGGAYLGGVSGKDDMKKEMEMALAQQEQVSQEHHHGKNKQRAYEIEPGLATELAHNKMKADGRTQKEFGSVIAEQQEAADQQPSR